MNRKLIHNYTSRDTKRKQKKQKTTTTTTAIK